MVSKIASMTSSHRKQCLLMFQMRIPKKVFVAPEISSSDKPIHYLNMQDLLASLGPNERASLILSQHDLAYCFPPISSKRDPSDANVNCIEGVISDVY
nr:unnamed protein product [Spirometra erinaceieuropaei]